MTQPKTLLEMSGADQAPAGLSKATILLIDCQNEYVSGFLPLPGVEAALVEISSLLERARAAKAPIVHIAHKGTKGGAFDREGPGGQITDAAAPKGDETVIEKILPNAFAGTDLADVLEKHGRKDLIVVGFMTHMCVSSTTRAALDHGYRCTVIANGAATRDLPDPDGGVIDAATLHRVSLVALADRFAIIAKSAADIGD